MKICLLVLLLVTYGSFDKNVTMSYIRSRSKIPIALITTECMCQSQLNHQILDEYFKYGKIPDDPCWKCFLRCLAFKLEIFSSTGDVNVQRWADLFEYFDLSMAERCSTFEELDLCQKAYLMLKCAYDELSKQYPP